MKKRLRCRHQDQHKLGQWPENVAERFSNHVMVLHSSRSIRPQEENGSCCPIYPRQTLKVLRASPPARGKAGIEEQEQEQHDVFCCAQAVEMAARWPTPVAIGQCCSCKTSRTNTPTQPDLYLRRQRDLTVLRKADSSSHTLRPPSPGFGPKVTFATTGLSFSLAIANVRSVGCMTSDQPRERSLANAALRNVENVALLVRLLFRHSFI